MDIKRLLMIKRRFPFPGMPIVKKHAFVIIGLILATALIYGQVVHHEFINFDDQDYVTENPYVQKGLSPESIAWAFSLHDNDLTYWHPLSYMAHMLDYELFGMNSGGHHLSNMLIHMINVILLYISLVYMTGSRNRSALTALVFAVHPICVDSVAWISQKKTLLATTLWLLSIIAYARYTRKLSLKSYSIVCFFVVLGLLTKPLMVTLPLVLLVLDIWPLNRLKYIDISNEFTVLPSRGKYGLKRLVSEKIPLVVFVVLWGITPFLSKHVVAKNIPLDVVPMGLRIKNALVSYFSYIKNFILPTELSFLYPYPETVSTIKAVIACACLLIIVFMVVTYLRKKPYLATGWMIFMIVLIPFLGFVQGAVWPAYADRFAYVPFIGLYILTVWGGCDLIRRYSIPSLVYTPLIFIWIIWLGLLSFRQTSYWKDNVRLYAHAIDITEKNYLAYNNLGIAYDQLGRHEDARKQYYLSLWAKPGFSKAHYNLAIHYLAQGDRKKAGEEFQKSLAANPDNPDALYNLGSIAMAEKSLAEAEAFYKKAISQKPDFFEAYNNLGVLFLKEGRLMDAASQFKMAVSINPNHSESLCNLGNALFDMKRPNDAIMCFTRALSLDKHNIKAMNDLAVVYSSIGKLTEAELLFQTILKQDPGNPSAMTNLRWIQKGRQSIQEKYDDVQSELSQNPENIELQMQLARLSQVLNKPKEAESIYLNILSRQSDDTTAMTELAQLYEAAGDYEKAKIYYVKFSETKPEQKAWAYYSTACMFSMEGRSDMAVSWLQKAADSGFSDWETLKADSRLNPIRRSPRFIEFTEVAGLR